MTMKMADFCVSIVAGSCRLLDYYGNDTNEGTDICYFVYLFVCLFMGGGMECVRIYIYIYIYIWWGGVECVERHFFKQNKRSK